MRDRVPSLLAAFLISSSFSLDLLSLRSLAGLVVRYLSLPGTLSLDSLSLPDYTLAGNYRYKGGISTARHIGYEIGIQALHSCTPDRDIERERERDGEREREREHGLASGRRQ